jgi:hypothetical protein
MTARAACGMVLAWGLMAATSVSGFDDTKLKKPRLDLKATPRFAFSPVTIFLTAELGGGDDIEEYHCLEVEWDWDDGGKSVHESDCAPFQPGVTKIQRRFTQEHEYRRAGIYNIKATLRRTGKALATSTARVTVRPGLGDRTIERE